MTDQVVERMKIEVVTSNGDPTNYRLLISVPFHGSHGMAIPINIADDAPAWKVFSQVKDAFIAAIKTIDAEGLDKLPEDGK